MKILSLNPAGLYKKEGALQAILLKYMASYGLDTYQLQCNGVFSLCARDAKTHFKRGALQCHSCISEQDAMRSWSDSDLLQVSQYLDPKEIVETKRWVESMEPAQLWSAVWKSVPIRTLLQGSFSTRFGTLEPDFQNKQHAQYVSRLSLAALRMLVASVKCHSQLSPELVFLTGGDEFITASYFAVSQNTKSSLVRFSLGPDEKNIKIHKGGTDNYYNCDYIPTDVTSFRKDVHSWPSELTDILNGVVDYLGLSKLQLELPLAR